MKSLSKETLTFEQMRTNSVDGEQCYYGYYKDYRAHVTVGSAYMEINVDYKDKSVKNFFGTLWIPSQKLTDVANCVQKIIDVVKEYDNE